MIVDFDLDENCSPPTNHTNHPNHPKIPGGKCRTEVPLMIDVPHYNHAKSI